MNKFLGFNNELKDLARKYGLKSVSPMSMDAIMDFNGTRKISGFSFDFDHNPVYNEPNYNEPSNTKSDDIYIDNIATIKMLKNVTNMLEYIEFNDMKNIILTLKKLKNDVNMLDEIIHKNLEGNLYK